MAMEDRMHQWAHDLSVKHFVSFEDALEVLVFFNGFMLEHPNMHADMLISSAKQWNIPPAQLINLGMEVVLTRMHKN